MGLKGLMLLIKSDISVFSPQESMGFKAGQGLGKFRQGRSDILEATQQRGRRGLGFKVEGFDEKDFEWYEEDKVHMVLDIDKLC